MRRLKLDLERSPETRGSTQKDVIDFDAVRDAQACGDPEAVRLADEILALRAELAGKNNLSEVTRRIDANQVLRGYEAEDDGQLGRSRVSNDKEDAASKLRRFKQARALADRNFLRERADFAAEKAERLARISALETATAAGAINLDIGNLAEDESNLQLIERLQRGEKLSDLARVVSERTCLLEKELHFSVAQVVRYREAIALLEAETRNLKTLLERCVREIELSGSKLSERLKRKLVDALRDRTGARQ
ncbi:unnamed protein product [Amoebophrya sp. A25]|nr:unnamed protein product [Amoebophrya sp. A25]|eukprot:GSA25T00024379001.1